MNREDYTNECYRQLNDNKFYDKLDKDPTQTIETCARILLGRLLKEKEIDSDTYKYLLPQDPKAGRFYILPKLHKQGNPGRPICSANGHPTERISEFVCHHLNPLACTDTPFLHQERYPSPKQTQPNRCPASKCYPCDPRCFLPLYKHPYQ